MGFLRPSIFRLFPFVGVGYTLVCRFIEKYWFLLALIGISLLTVLDNRELLVNAGIRLKEHNGPDNIIVLIFFLSGLALNTEQLKAGLTDTTGTFLALLLIFFIAPFLAFLFSFIPLETGIIIGIFLVASMPTTLSSGVVMTGTGGGNSGHALLITIIANSLAVITIPVVLGILLSLTGDSRIIEIDRLPIMIKIGSRVLLPLAVGITIAKFFSTRLQPFLKYTALGNQLGILCMVWMALCSGRREIIAQQKSILLIFILVFSFHLLLILSGLLITSLCGIGKGRRESVIIMGGQKTLPLSVILQVALFPSFGIALVVCVMHHITHLIMDAFLTRYLQLPKGDD